MIEWNSVRAAYIVAGRQTLHETLLERLRQMIQEGELAPGTRLSEQALCGRFGVSRTRHSRGRNPARGDRRGL